MNKILAITLVLAFAGSGCAKKVQIHPGAISNLDSYSYDVLITEQAAIGQAKAEFQAGTLPTEAKGPLNAAIQQYNSTLATWNSYHATGQGSSALEQAVAALVTAVAEIQKIKGKGPSPLSLNYHPSEVWA